jgi:hypothetical protein
MLDPEVLIIRRDFFPDLRGEFYLLLQKRISAYLKEILPIVAEILHSDAITNSFSPTREDGGSPVNQD